MFKSKLTGKQKVFSQLRKIAPSVERDLDDGLRKNATELASAARGYAPKNTGDYAKSIVGRRVTDRDFTAKQRKRQASKVAGLTTIPAYGVFADYVWRFIEFGTQPATKGAKVASKRSRNGTRKSYRTHPGTPARPHMFPAFRSLKRRMVSRTSRTINKSVRQATNK